MFLTHVRHILEAQGNSNQLWWLCMIKKAAAMEVSSFLTSHVRYNTNQIYTHNYYLNA